MIQTAAMYISFFHFEVRVTSGDCRIVIFARIRIDNFNGHEELVSWLKRKCRYRSAKIFLDSHTNFPRNTIEKTMQSWSTSAYFARSMVENSLNMRDKQR